MQEVERPTSTGPVDIEDEAVRPAVERPDPKPGRDGSEEKDLPGRGDRERSQTRGKQPRGEGQHWSAPDPLGDQAATE